ncbi:MAG: adenine deaminase [Opitutaceae bacterium]
MTRGPSKGRGAVRRVRGWIVDVVRREEFHGAVEIAAGRIRRVVREPGPRASARRGPLILPGFVDAHIHVESSLLPPAEFARLAVTHGTVATVSDPHEIANVLGAAGVAYMLAEARKTPLKILFGAPSCVPATDRESAGAVLDAKAVARLLRRPDIGYLSEVMNFPGVLKRDPSLLGKIAAARALGKPVDGHAPGLGAKAAKAYAAAGISTDHECFTLGEARGKLRAGMKILIREGSAARNFAALAPLLLTDPARCMFCCDDLHPDLLVRRHVDELVRRALAWGADRFDAVACASLNPVRHYGLKVGLLQPGDPADFIVADGWKRLRVQRTYIDGRLAADRGRCLWPRRRPAVANRFRAERRRLSDFIVPAAGRRVRAIQALDGQLVTRAALVPARIAGGAALADPARDLLKIAVVNRYRPRAPVAAAFVRGFGLRRGAIASSVAHDSHNIVAVGTGDEELAAAVNAIVRLRGGICVVDGGRVFALPLPIAGLMAVGEGRAVARRYIALDRRAKRMGSRLRAPFMTLSFMALLVIPDLKLSDRGLFSGIRWRFEPVFA